MGQAITYAPPSILASGASFAQLRAGGLGAILDLIVAANPAIANPATAPTVNATGGGSTGGGLPAGTYYLSYAWGNGVGRTLPRETAASFTVAAGNIPAATVPAFPAGVASAAIYLTQPGGAPGTETLYGVATATTFNLASAAWADPLTAPPAANTTALVSLSSYVMKPRRGAAQDLYAALTQELHAFASGAPIVQAQALTRLHQLDAAFTAIAQAIHDAVGLCYANTGTLATVVTSTGSKQVRTFP